MKHQRNVATALMTVAMVFKDLVAMAAPLPLDLPRPDGKPGNPGKPVKVYILAGQSNMVGMGDVAGARPAYPSIFLSADPAIIPGAMPIGGAGLAAHGVYQSAEANAAKGARVSIYQGAFDPKADYAKLTPGKTATVALRTVAEKLPAMDGPHTVVVSAFIDLPASGNYAVHAGFEESACNVVTLDGKEVYRKDVGGKPVITKVALETGRRYPVAITCFKGGSAAFWLEQVDIEGKGDLKTLTQKDGKFPYLQDDAGAWSVRNDVTYTDPRLFPQRAASPLSATSNNGKSIGPEVGFGHVMGTFHDEQVLLIKTAQGNRSLGFDFRPPSSGRADPTNKLLDGPWKGVWEAQMAVGDPKQHPEFAGTVASVDTRDFWREVEESPRGQDYHYNRNPET